MFTSLQNFRDQVLTLVGFAPPYNDTKSPGFGKHPSVLADMEAQKKEPEPIPVLLFGEMEVYPSIYGYPKRGLKVYRATETGERGAYFGFIKEEPVPGEDGNLAGCVYYTKDRRLQTKNAPRFYASPMALITAAGLSHYNANPLGAGTALLGHTAKDQEAEHATAMQGDFTGTLDIKGPDQGVGDTAGGTSDVQAHHPADLDPEPEAIKVDQRVRATSLTPATNPGAKGIIHNVHGDGFIVHWDGDIAPRDRMYYRHQVDFLDNAGNVIGKPAGVDQSGFAAAPVD